MEKIKINSLEIENVKRIKAVKVEPTANGLNVIGGKNNQGKTSVLDAIAWALGGNKFKPSKAAREGSVVPPYLKVTLSNGYIVERKGKNSTLKVTDPSGKKSGQQLLDGFIEELALNIPKFMAASNKEKANTLLNIIGVGPQLAKLDHEENKLYQERLAIGRIADRKKKSAEEMIFYADAPNDLVSPSQLIKQQQEILARNGENQRKREKVSQYEYQVQTLTEEVARTKKLLKTKENELNQAAYDLSIAKTDTLDLIDESTEELENNIRNIEQINIRVRTNLEKNRAEEEAKNYEDQYIGLTEKIEKVRKEKISLLDSADLPLDGLSIEDGELIYKGQKWDNMSGSDQMKVSTAIVRKLNPKCAFVLLDKLEQMDIDSMNEFGKWLEAEGLQAIATRVSTGDECSIIIEDGYVKDQDHTEIKENNEPKWKAGVF